MKRFKQSLVDGGLILGRVVVGGVPMFSVRSVCSVIGTVFLYFPPRSMTAKSQYDIWESRPCLYSLYWRQLVLASWGNQTVRRVRREIFTQRARSVSSRLRTPGWTGGSAARASWSSWDLVPDDGVEAQYPTLPPTVAGRRDRVAWRHAGRSAGLQWLVGIDNGLQRRPTDVKPLLDMRCIAGAGSVEPAAGLLASL